MNIDELVKNEVRKVINEVLSIAQDVTEATNTFIDLFNAEFERKYGKFDISYYDDLNSGFKLSLYSNNITVKHSFEWSGEIYLSVDIVYFPTYETLDKYWASVNEAFNEGGHVEGNTINCKLFAIAKNPNVSSLRSILSHELEHMYQICKSRKSIVGDSYSKARDIIKRKDMHHQTRGHQAIAYLYYFMTNAEIHANVNGFYHELVGVCKHFKDNDVKKYANMTRLYREYNEVFNSDYEYFINSKTSTEVINAVKYLGFRNTNEFEHYLNNQIRYFKKKIMKVTQNAINTLQKNRLKYNDRKIKAIKPNMDILKGSRN